MTLIFYHSSVVVPEEEQDLPHLPSPLEVIVQASQQTHYFPQNDEDRQVDKTESVSTDFSITLYN